MEAHLRLSAANYPVISFGTGSLVRLPGPSLTQPNVYQFNKTSYDSMYKELEDIECYTCTILKVLVADMLQT